MAPWWRCRRLRRTRTAPTWRSACAPSTSNSPATARCAPQVFGVEYLGTTQIVTLQLADGTRLKARVPSTVPARAGDQTGLRLRSERLTLFRRGDGRALRSALHESKAAHG